MIFVITHLTTPGCNGGGNQIQSQDDKKTAENQSGKPDSTKGPLPKITSDKLVHEFGIMAVNESQTRAFVIKNEGDAELDIKDITYTCKCTMPDMDKVKRKLKPGESTDMPVTWTPKAPNKTFEQVVTVISNDPNKPRLEIIIRGEVEQSILFEPDQLFNVGDLPGNKSVPFTGKIYNRIRDDMDVVSVKTNSEYVVCNVEKMKPDQLKLIDAKSGFNIIGEVKPNKLVGNFEAIINYLVKTGNDTPKDYVFQVKGFHAGPINIIGTNFNSAEGKLLLDRFDSTKGLKKQMTLFIKSEDKTPLEIKSVRVEPLFIKLDIQKDEKLTRDKVQVYKMFIEVPPGSPPTIKNTEEPGVISFETTHPDLPKMSWKLEMLSY